MNRTRTCHPDTGQCDGSAVQSEACNTDACDGTHICFTSYICSELSAGHSLANML